MNGYLEALRPKMSEADYKKLCAITNHKVYEFIAKSSDMCNCKNIFICGDSDEDITHVRKQAITLSTSTAYTIRDATVKPRNTSFPEAFPLVKHSTKSTGKKDS